LLDIGCADGVGYLLGSINYDALDEAVCGNLGGGSKKPQKSGFHQRRHPEQMIVGDKKLVEKEWILRCMISGPLGIRKMLVRLQDVKRMYGV
jgi:hypothetical protein